MLSLIILTFIILNINLYEIWRVLLSWLFFLTLENKDIILVQISFDGNNIENPPNLMTDDTFEGIKIRLNRNFASYINIVYTGKHDFQECDINRNAEIKLKSLSKNEKRGIVRKRKFNVCLFVLVVFSIAGFSYYFNVSNKERT